MRERHEAEDCPAAAPASDGREDTDESARGSRVEALLIAFVVFISVFIGLVTLLRLAG